MVLLQWRKYILPFAFLLGALLLVACGDSSTSQVQAKPTPTPPPSPTAGPGQHILDTMANKLNSAKTLHGIFNLTLSGQTINGTVNTEVWNAAPNKNRTVVLQSSISQLTTGTVNVTDGKQQWQYEPAQKVVYTGPVTTGTQGTPTGGTAGGQGNQSLFLLNLVQSVFTNSDGTLKSSATTVNGHTVYDVAVQPSTSRAGAGGPANFNYTGDVYIDKATHQPVQVKLNITGIGDVTLDVPELELNSNLPANTFTFVVPAGVKVLPFSQLSATPSTGALTLAQAQQQAGYHLLSIPADQTDYALNGVNALGAPGNQTYTLNYMKGNATITIAEGKPLANLPLSGQSVSLRGTTATLSTVNGITTLAWTEKGIGIRISSGLSSDQVQSIAKSLT